MQTPNLLVKDALYEILNGMSSAVNGMWNFQIVESSTEISGNSEASELTIIDANLPLKSGDLNGVFEIQGTDSIFQDVSLDIDLTGAKMNQIIAERSNITVAESKPSTKSAIFSGNKDLVIEILRKQAASTDDATTEPQTTVHEQLKQKNVELLNQLESYRSKFSEDDPLALYQESLVGGDRGAGAHLFYNSDAGQCTRCHAIFEYGGNAGPLLDGIGNRLDRRQILTSLVAPSESFAQGYEIATIIKNDDTEVTGIILERSAESTKLKVGKEDILTIANSDIKATENVPSSMPIMKDILTRRELRDLVEFLTRLN